MASLKALVVDSGITKRIVDADTLLVGAGVASSTGALSVDTSGAAAVNMGAANATSIAVGRSGITTTVTGGLTQMTGAVSLTGNAASSLTTSSGALTLTSAAAATWSTSAGALTLNGGGGMNLQGGGTSALNVNSAGTALTVQSGATLATTGTGNINLPNNGSARFQIEGVAVGATVTSANLSTLTNGSNADALHVHSAANATQLAVSGLTTTGLTDGDFAYVSAANTLTKTDADALASSRLFGANEGTASSATVAGVIDNAKFTTAGGSPSNGAAVYLAPGTEEASASGKLTATPPSGAGQFSAEVAICLDNANYAGLKTAKVLLQPKTIIAL